MIRLAVVGASYPGRAMIEAARRTSQLEVVALVDTDERALAAADIVAANAFRAIDELPDGSVDAVYVATPTPLHHDHVLAACARLRCHVIVEKPMAANVEAAGAMIDAVAATGRQLLVGQTQSYEPGPRRLAALVASGELGALVGLHSLWVTDWMRRPRRPIDLAAEAGGGVVFRQGAHQFDVLRLVAGGLARRVRASCRPIEGASGASAFTAELEFDDGVLATAVYDGRAGAADDCDILTGVFADGLVTVTPVGLTVARGEQLRHEAFGEASRGWNAVVDEIVDVLVHGRPAVHSGEWGRATLEVCEAVHQSHATQHTVDLELQVPALRPGD